MSTSYAFRPTDLNSSSLITPRSYSSWAFLTRNVASSISIILSQLRCSTPNGIKIDTPANGSGGPSLVATKASTELMPGNTFALVIPPPTFNLGLSACNDRQSSPSGVAVSTLPPSGIRPWFKNVRVSCAQAGCCKIPMKTTTELATRLVKVLAGAKHKLLSIPLDLLEVEAWRDVLLETFGDE